MSLAATLKKAAKTVIQAADDLAIRVTYVQVTPGTYQPVSDSGNNTEVSTTQVPAILCRAREEEVDWTPVRTDVKKALIAYSDLPITPELTDRLVISGDNWEIRKIKPVPGSPVHVLFVEAV